MKELLAEVSANHFPNPPATPAQVAAFEGRMGWKLDEDLRAFYLHCDGAALFQRFPDANYHLLPLEQIRRARVAMRPGDDDHFGPTSWYTLVDLQDSDYVILDAAHQVDGKYPVLDAYHETFPEAVRPIAASFSEFLERALASGDDFFWLSGSTPES
ncbi:SMI1/KNR4 family protein [Corallococcus exiguus]|nr:SMI1/KNR4 family protein [Corallococcus exiguus]NNC00237.1 SMI1/KNR4 family protein [Corallococcus exiguus]NNC09152.1 SMI1/KNR4 family protein [Corallococcus exiguus]NPC53154.1 SMI1/KNR4 family protein [Corallococcus exiguus]RKH79453.1 SMI1/KNR4 family protein [Corallococcus sp. AB032C]